MKRLIFAGIVTTMLGSSSLVACGGGSCLEEYPCDVPADDPDASFDGSSHDAVADVAASDASDFDSAIDDASTDATDGSDAADD